MKPIVLLFLGLLVRPIAASCATEETSFKNCYASATGGLTYGDDPFDTFYEDDESWSLRDCASLSAEFNARCEDGPGICQTDYEAWVECGYEELATDWGLDCGFAFDCSTPPPTPAPTPKPTPQPTPQPSQTPTPRPTPAPSPAPTPAPTPRHRRPLELQAMLLARRFPFAAAPPRSSSELGPLLSSPLSEGEWPGPEGGEKNGLASCP